VSSTGNFDPPLYIHHDTFHGEAAVFVRLVTKHLSAVHENAAQAVISIRCNMARTSTLT